jgi:hypothetical protein
MKSLKKRSLAMYVSRIYFVCQSDVFSKDGTWIVRRHVRWWIVKLAVVTFTDKAYGCGTRNVEFLRVNPSPELLAKHHPQEAEQGYDGGSRTLHPNQTVQNPYTKTNYKGYEQDSHYISPAQIRLEISKNWANVTSRKGA